jgi:L-asparagine transporter-like permease
MKMKLSSPKQLTWIVALILALLGLIGELGVVDALADFSFWLAFISAALLLLATWIKGL